MRKITTTLLLFLFLCVIAFAWQSWTKEEKKIPVLRKPMIKTEHSNSKTSNQFRTKSISAKQFAKQNQFDTAVCFLIDMNLPSNQKRFFIYDLIKDTVLKSGLVTHGNCNEYWLEEKKYSNAVGCGCTSLGKYRIGNSYYGRFGLAFKLHGLDKTNNNAYTRYVVLHSHDCVPESEVEEDICQSNGCPTVSPSFLKTLQGIITKTKKPVLLWIYDEKNNPYED